MNAPGNFTRYRARSVIAVAVSLVLGACATVPLDSTGAAEARAKLSVLQSDANLASRAPDAITEAEAAVVAAEASQTDADESAHLAYLANRKVETARARAETRFSEDQRATLAAQRESARLEARTLEADIAKGQVATARADAEVARISAAGQIAQARTDVEVARISAAGQTEQARTEAETARIAAAGQAEKAQELQRQIDELQAKPTDRGLVLTLGDVLFNSGRADLNAGATSSLNKLAAFLNHYPDRGAAIEGHTDSMGSDEQNQGLSQRRAEAVKSYLVGQGIGTIRLAAAGKGENQPLASNDSAQGRQQNRRVEVIIDNPK